jgi:hypothetical protein
MAGTKNNPKTGSKAGARQTLSPKVKRLIRPMQDLWPYVPDLTKKRIDRNRKPLLPGLPTNRRRT